ncbi:MAG: hypothetical protein CTY15_05610 [Methylocystis sp.]|nr:MAG: hypothetical protein CTY15_05610 [Methylocystis sp.]
MIGARRGGRARDILGECMADGGGRAVKLSAADMRFVVAEMLDCRMSRQYERFTSYVDPAVVLHCHSWRVGIVGPKVWRGASGVRELFRRTDENYLPLGYEIVDILVDGENAVVRWRADWRRHENGCIYTNDAAHFLRWENGLVVEMHEFFDAHCPSTPGCACPPSFEALFTPRPAGLSRDEMERRARKLISFEEDGPDHVLLRQWCSPDIVCEFVGDKSRIPYAGRHIGIEAVIGIIRAIRVEFEQRLQGVSDVLIEDSRVGGRRHVQWRHRGTGRTGVSELADFVRFDDGLIVELIEFRDTVTLRRMQD